MLILLRDMNNRIKGQRSLIRSGDEENIVFRLELSGDEQGARIRKADMHNAMRGLTPRGRGSDNTTR